MAMERTKYAMRFMGAVTLFFFFFLADPLRDTFLNFYVPGSEEQWDNVAFSFTVSIMRYNQIIVLALTMFLAHATSAGDYAVQAGGLFQVFNGLFMFWNDMSYMTVENGFPYGYAVGGLTHALIIGIFVYSLWQDWLKDTNWKDVMTHNFHNDNNEGDAQEKPHLALTLGVLGLMATPLLISFQMATNMEAVVNQTVPAQYASVILSAGVKECAQAAFRQLFTANLSILFIYFHCYRNGATSVGATVFVKTIASALLMPHIVSFVGAQAPSAMNPLTIFSLGLTFYGLCMNVGGNQWSLDRIALSVSYAHTFLFWMLWKTQERSSFAALTTEAVREWGKSSQGAWIDSRFVMYLVLLQLVILAVIVYNSDALNEVALLTLLLVSFVQTVNSVFFEAKFPIWQDQWFGVSSIAINIAIPVYVLWRTDRLAKTPQLIRGLFNWSFTSLHTGAYLVIALNLVLQLRNVFSWSSVVDQFVDSEHRSLWMSEATVNLVPHYSIVNCTLLLGVYLVVRNADHVVLHVINYALLFGKLIMIMNANMQIAQHGQEWGANPPVAWALGVDLIQVVAIVATVAYHARAKKKVE